MIYAILDTTGKCINKINWDGESSWTPPEGCTVVLDVEGKYDIAAGRNQTAPPVTPPVEEPAKTPEEILATLTPEQIQALITLLNSSINTEPQNQQLNESDDNTIS